MTPMWGPQSGGVLITQPCFFRELGSSVTPEWGWFPSPHKASHGGPALPSPPHLPWVGVTYRGSSCFWGTPLPPPHTYPIPRPS